MLLSSNHDASALKFSLTKVFDEGIEDIHGGKLSIKSCSELGERQASLFGVLFVASVNGVGRRVRSFCHLAASIANSPVLAIRFRRPQPAKWLPQCLPH